MFMKIISNKPEVLITGLKCLEVQENGGKCMDDRHLDIEKRAIGENGLQAFGRTEGSRFGPERRLFC